MTVNNLLKLLSNNKTFFYSIGLIASVLTETTLMQIYWNPFSDAVIIMSFLGLIVFIMWVLDVPTIKSKNFWIYDSDYIAQKESTK